MLRRRPFGLALLGVASSAALGACSLFVDTSGFATGDVIVLSEAGAAEAASAVDVDGGASGGDATTTGEAGASPCGTAHAFCADFEGPKYQAGWDSIDDDVPGGILDTGVGAFESGKGLRAFLPRRDAVKGYATLGKHIQTPLRRVVVDFDMKLDAVLTQPSDNTVGLICVALYAGSTQGGVCLGVGPGFSPFGVTNGPTLDTGRWVHGHVELDPASQTATALVGGKSYSSTWTRPTGTGTQQVFVQLGALGYNLPAPAVGVAFDNVVVDFP